MRGLFDWVLDVLADIRAEEVAIMVVAAGMMALALR